MRVLVDLPERLFKRIERLCDEGRYDSPSTFIRLAIENQLVLETDEAASRLGLEESTVERTSSSAAWSGFSGFRSYEAVPEEALEPDWLEEVRQAAGRPVEAVDLTRELYNRSDVLDLAADATNMLPGLISRLLPIKFAARVLYSVLAVSGQKTVPLDEFLDRVGEYALRMGDWLVKLDLENGRRREEALAAGFPTSNRDAAKSKERYRNLFVASVRSKERKADGALPFLKLSVLYESRNEIYIGLTSAGKAFASLRNPVIDDSEMATTALSLEERRFLLVHVRDWVPGEYKAAQLVVGAIHKGVTERSALNGLLASEWPGWSADQVNSWRSGLLSRLAELGLLERSREGRSLEYRLTSDALELLG